MIVVIIMLIQIQLITNDSNTKHNVARGGPLRRCHSRRLRPPYDIILNDTAIRSIIIIIIIKSVMTRIIIISMIISSMVMLF